MKRKWPRTGIVIWMSFVMLFVSATGATGVPSDPAKTDTAAVMQTGTGYLENITFEKLKGLERATLMLSSQSGVATEDQGERLLLVRLENLFVPQDLRRVQGEGALENLIRVVPAQRTVKGIPQAVVAMELNKKVPYSVRQDGLNIVIDFNVAALSQKTAVAAAKPATLAQSAPVRETPSQPLPAVRPADTPVGLISTSFKQENFRSADVNFPRKIISNERDLDVLQHANILISLNFQGPDAYIRSIFRSLAELGRVNIALSDDIIKSKATADIHLDNVTWKRAFYAVVQNHDLIAHLSSNNLITVDTLKHFREEEAKIAASEKTRWDADKARREELQNRLEREGRLPQVSIEAKIIEATDDFVRKLGVQWGAGMRGDLELSGTNYPYGFLAGANPVGSTPFGPTMGLASTGLPLVLTAGNLAANFPMALSAPSYALGFAIQGSRAVLDAQILASEKTSEIKIISSPKVTTMHGSKAVIKQGEEVPYTTPASTSAPPTVSFKEAVLKLEVVPSITEEGKISMVVTASNDIPNYTRSIQGNPPINKSQVESKVVVNDGDTLVIGGILKEQTEKGNTGLPWISKVPILGWLFKYEDTTKLRKQLLIFVTPRIVKKDEQSVTEVEPKGAIGKPRS